MEELLAFNAALALAEKLIPIIAANVKAGQVSVEEQETARTRYLALRQQGDTIFSAPHWKP